MTSIRTPTAVDFGRLLLTSAIWGSAFLCIELALQNFAPIAIACWRVVIACLIILLFCWLKGLRIPVDAKTLLLFTVLGFINTVIPFSFISWGQQSVDSATTALLLSSSPFATLVFVHLFSSDEQVTKNRVIGLIIGFSGVALLFVQEIVLEGNSIFGMLSIVLAACCYSMSALLIRKLGQLPSLVVVAGSLTTSSLILMPITIWLAPPWEQSFSTISLAAILFLAVGPTAAAYVLRTQIVQLNGAIFMSNAGYLIPLFAVLWAWLFLNRVPELIAWCAMLLVFVGIYVGQRSYVATTAK